MKAVIFIFGKLFECNYSKKLWINEQWLLYIFCGYSTLSSFGKLIGWILGSDLRKESLRKHNWFKADEDLQKIQITVLVWNKNPEWLIECVRVPQTIMFVRELEFPKSFTSIQLHCVIYCRN